MRPAGLSYEGQGAPPWLETLRRGRAHGECRNTNSAAPLLPSIGCLRVPNTSGWLQEFPSLTLKKETYTHVTGKQAQLLLAEGTLPMYYSVRGPRLLLTCCEALLLPPGRARLAGSLQT